VSSKSKVICCAFSLHNKSLPSGPQDNQGNRGIHALLPDSQDFIV
jgi:hypothetical protein